MSTLKQLLHYLPVLMLLVASPGTVTAQWEQYSPVTRELITMSVNPTTDLSLSGRGKLVRLIATYCREVLTALPTNTPREDDWGGLGNED
jgi:hypothetical protein